MTMMDTHRSERMADDFLARNQPYKRKVVVVEKRFTATPEVVFKQLCPTREADWIDGWTADLIWTTTGYAEPDCIFTTPDTNVAGPGLWVFTRMEPDKLVEFVRLIDRNVVEQARIDVVAREDGTCTGIWTVKFTALNTAGNTMVDAIGEADQKSLLPKVLSGLEHFVTTGKRMAIGH